MIVRLLRATRNWKRSQSGTCGSTSSVRKSAIASSSSPAVGRSCIAPPTPSVDQAQDLVLGLGRAPADRGQLLAAHLAVEVGLRLHDGDHAPAQVAEDLPEAPVLPRDGEALRLVARREILQR